ncbi:MAG: mechanosensitive ion channel family protein [Methylotenera sp.]|nr:mechanosensitive ion channel family protein [Oligoflexia bacterium]
MNSHLSQPWIPLSRIESLIQLEPALAVLGLALGAWLIYKIFLRDISVERHTNLKNLFSNLLMHMGLWIVLFITYGLLQKGIVIGSTLERFSSYLGLVTLISGAVVFVKTCRILLFEYLFLGHMNVGVPVLLVNLFTLLISICMTGWIATEVFNVRLAPLLATSAIFSLVLGLALQDTLGNLFAGVALQLDKPYEIGDWIEIKSGPEKRVGQVYEISWRATLLIGLSEEALTIPNRMMAQAEVSNFSKKQGAILRSQIFKVPYGVSIPEVKNILTTAATKVLQVRKEPAPVALVSETSEAGMSFKVVYSITEFGSQFMIANGVITACVEALENAGIRLAPQRVQIVPEATPALSQNIQNAHQNA